MGRRVRGKKRSGSGCLMASQASPTGSLVSLMGWMPISWMPGRYHDGCVPVAQVPPDIICSVQPGNLQAPGVLVDRCGLGG